MYTVGLDVDKYIVFTGKILLYAGNFHINSPSLLILAGTIYLFYNFIMEQSAGNFSFNRKATALVKNTYNKYIYLSKISEHRPKHKSDLTDQELGHFLAGLIEGDG
jgi:hypothetical protein